MSGDPWPDIGLVNPPRVDEGRAALVDQLTYRPLPLSAEFKRAWQQAAGHAAVASRLLCHSLAKPDGRERETVTCHAIRELLAGVEVLAREAGFPAGSIAIHPDLLGFLEPRR